MKLKDRIKKWTITHAKGPQGKFWLALFSFTESSFFPIPPDFIMIAVLLARQRHRWFFYALLTTIFSVLGGLFGYCRPSQVQHADFSVRDVRFFRTFVGR